jgi:GTP1/Obg family GTP-binding protein
MPSLNDILREIEHLSDDERRILMDYMKRIEAQRSEDAAKPQRKQLFGRYRGQVYMADDFDAELPDSFWLGDDRAVSP